MFFAVFFNSHRCETPENAIKTKKIVEKLTSKMLSICLGKVFDMGFFFFNGVFELPFPRNKKRPKTY
jgi:hypothetical protein